MLDNLKFRKLDNGYTVKYHVANPADTVPSGFGGEIFVTDIDQLEKCVSVLIAKHLEDAECPVAP